MTEDEKRQLLVRIMNAEVAIICCAPWGQQCIPSAKITCTLCGDSIAMDSLNTSKVQEDGIIPVCLLCAAAIMELADESEVSAMIGGQRMSVEDGFRQIDLLQRRN